MVQAPSVGTITLNKTRDAISQSCSVYSSQFYDDMSRAADHAARHVVPLIVEAIGPQSVIDVGSGTGAWLRVFGAVGVDDIIGVDGAWVQREALTIPAERFVQADLKKPLNVRRRFDLCISLETAEHLPESRAPGFIADLTALSDVVVFSAAVPFQGGTHHLNERWQNYRVEKFAAHGYVGVDYLRKRIWHLEEFNTWFYAQNMIVFVQESALSSYPVLDAEYKYQAGPPLPLVHPGLLTLHLPWQKHVSLRWYFGLLPRMLGRLLKRSVGGRPAPLVCTPPGVNDWRRE